MAASRAWQGRSGFGAVPRMLGCSGESARRRWARTRSSSIIARTVAGASGVTLATSWDVRKPSKKWRNGTRASRVAAWATRARSIASCTEPDASMAKPVARAAITSLWSPKIDRAWVATARAATWTTAGVNSPATL